MSAAKPYVFFASDVHLGLAVKDPSEREARFLRFLRAIPAQKTSALYLLGDIWDFWYEYKDVVPKVGVRVCAALADLVDAGVAVYFFPGNHDIWCYGFFDTLGVKVVKGQPKYVNIDGKNFCIGHGDGLGPGMWSYKFMNSVFKCYPLQRLFSMLHPRIAFGLARKWSRHSRLSHETVYTFEGVESPIYQYAQKYARKKPVDYFIFGHLHVGVDLTLPRGERFLIMDDWIDGDSYLFFDGTTICSGHLPNTE